MRKLFGVLGLIVLCSAADIAWSRMCFLPGVISGDCVLDDDVGAIQCAGFSRTTPCPSGYNEQTCVKNGKTLYKCLCRSDNIKQGLGSKYLCETSYDANCGCAAENTVCNTAIYAYEGCSEYHGTVPGSDFCQSPKDGTMHYKTCTCSTSTYPYTCTEKGLKAPSSANYCEDVSGVKRYPYCLCDDNWSTEACTGRTDGCTYMSDSVYNGINTCYLCSAEKCKSVDQINLDAYWCSPSQSRCEALGYMKLEGGTCPDGSVGLKCPFDSSYQYCTIETLVCTKNHARDASDCGDGTGKSKGWQLGSEQDISKCYKCEAKECPEGESTDTSLDACGEGEHWSRVQDINNYAGDKVCYKCRCDADEEVCKWTNDNKGNALLTDVCCDGSYKTCTSQCVAVTIPEHAYGTEECVGCGQEVFTAWECEEGWVKNDNGDGCKVATCNENCALSAGSCGTTGEKGYELGDNCNLAGTIYCQECTPKTCPTDESTDADISACPEEDGWERVQDENNYSGEDACYKCECGADEEVCKWTDENKGNAELEDPCCNDKYKTCVSGCKEVQVPEYATVTETCTGCKVTVNTAWECNEGYVKNADETACEVATCDENCSVDIGSCGTTGEKGYTLGADCNLSGTQRCKQCTPKECPDGESTDSSDAACPDEIGLERVQDKNNYSGEDACYKCECAADESVCKWTDKNKGNALLTDVCCNGSYKTCTSQCVAVAIPEHAYGTEECVGCGQEVFTAWECENGYAKNAQGTGCQVAICNKNCAVTANNCGGEGGSGAKGWYLGENCNQVGSQWCKQCLAKECPEGESTVSDVSACREGNYWRRSQDMENYSGNNACYGCSCMAMSTICKWNVKNAGNADLTDLCCNGNYETCNSKCIGVVIPENGHGTTECEACGNKVFTDWECDEGYTKNGIKCEPAQCNSGCALDVNDCGNKKSGSKGWTLGADCNLSGTQRCKQCTPKECPEGESTSNSPEGCGNGEKYWERVVDTANYAGDKACWGCKCEAPASCEWTDSNKGTATLSNKCCNGNYETCRSDCIEVVVPNHARGTEVCTGCGTAVFTDWECEEGYSEVSGACVVATCNSGCALDADDCGNGIVGSKGWFLGANCNLSGTQQCKKCTARTCPPDESTDSSDAACPDAIGWERVQNLSNYAGDKACWGCKCEAPASCEWTDKNKGDATLSGLCCNGNYETCKSSCVEVVIPNHAHGTKICTGCGEDVFVDWECDEGYSEIGRACKISTCDNGCALDADDCGNGTGKSKGWSLGTNCNLSGTQQCKKCTAKTCPTGESTNNLSSSCGKGERYWVKVQDEDHYAGDSACYICECNATDTVCKWEEGDEGTGTLDNKCCNGNYATCISDCDGVDLPKNASATKTCTGCGETVVTAWKCNDGYVINSAGDGCRLATCNDGCALSAGSCGTTGEKGYTLGANCNQVGDSWCKKCTAKTCPSGESTSTDTAICGSEKYWKRVQDTSNYAGNSACYSCKCEALTSCKWTSSNKGTATLSNKCCDGNYETCKSSCVEVSVPTNATVTATCTGCGVTVNTEWKCNNGYTKDGNSCIPAQCNSGCATSADDCGNGSGKSKGWSLGTNCNLSGTQQCKKCTAKSCTSGNTNSDVSTCGYASTRYASKTANGYYSGDSKCYSCSCSAPAACKWTNSNKGTATLSNQCCNGNYETCKSSCVEVSVPTNATVTATCTGCGSTVNTEWKCNNGYTKDGNSCIPAQCNSGCATSADDCGNGSGKSKGWSLGTNCNLSGTQQCKKCTAKSCTSGNTNSDVSTCGYASTRYASKTANGYYSGDSKCYSCSCSAPAACKWTNSNKGTATLSNQCCNGNYETCKSSCIEVVVPGNAHGTTECTGCGSTVFTEWECNEGYTKSGNSCVPSTCNSGCAIYVSDCGTTGSKGYTLGTNCNLSGDSWCKKCTARSCPSGESTSTSTTVCGSEKYWTRVANTYNYSGERKCYRCSCSAPAACKWTNDNKGSATLSNKCCNNRYETCKSTCVGVTVPANATTSSSCTGCGTTVSTAWKCKSGYCKSGSSCPRVCASSSYPYSAISNATMSGSCTGYRSTSGGSCSGNSATYYSGFTCKSGYCKRGSSCPKFCSSTTYPLSSKVANATMGSSCTGYRGTSGGSCSSTSSATYYSGFTCNEGYTKSGNSCVPSTCNSGCATAVGNCGTTGSKGYTLGANCNLSGTNWCKKCTAKSCPSGKSTSTSTSVCGSEKYWKRVQDTSNYAGNSACYSCSCTATTTTCKWTNDNKGSATLSNKCCNNRYETCTSSCVAASIPANATGTTPCTGCGSTVNTAWKCNSNYCKSGSACKAICSSTYKYSTAIANATMTGACTGAKGTSQGNCTSTGTYYSGFTCNTNYCKSGDSCKNICSSTTYPLSSKVSNATMGSSCTGYRGTSGGSCSSTSSATYYSGFTCNTNYCKSGSGCKAICSSTYKYSTAIANATMTGACTGAKGTSKGSCTSTGTYYSGFTCNTNYCKSGDSCKKICSSTTYPLSSKVANATMGSSCTGYRGTSKGSCSTSSSATYYSSFTCKSGYTKSGNSCVPSTCNSGCATAVGNCGTTGSKGYTLGANCNLSGTNWCKKCTAKSCPSGKSTSTSTSVCGSEKYWKRVQDTSNYAGNSACYSCSCTATTTTCKWTNDNKGSATLSNKCCNNRYETCTSSCVAASIPANATGTTPCTGCGSTVNTAWKCNSNYCKSGSACKAICSSTYKYSTAIANATMTGACTGAKGTSQGNCTSTGTYYSGFTCNTNYCKSGDSCKKICSSTTYPLTSTVSNATMGSSCTGYRGTSKGSCSTSSSATYYSGFTCNANYCKSGSGCKAICSSTYKYSTAIANATMTGACTGAKGTSKGSCTSTGTYYSGFTCNDGYVKSGNSCVAATCNLGCKTNVAACGKLGSSGWTLGANCNLSGTSWCKKCTARSCPRGSSTTAKTCSAKQKKVTKGYSGDTACTVCSTCKTNYASAASGCGTRGATGWKLGITKDSIGCYICTAKACPSGSHVEGNFQIACPVNQEKVLTGYSGDSPCYKCQIRPACSSGYARRAADCGTTGTSGWNLGTRKDSAGCYKCTAKSCPSGSSTTTTRCLQGGYTLQTVGYSGDKACNKCVSNTVPGCCFSAIGGSTNKYYKGTSCYSYSCAGCTKCPTWQ